MSWWYVGGGEGILNAVTGDILAAGAQTLTSTAPATTVLVGAVTVASGAQTLTFSAPTATAFSATIVAAGQTLLTFSAPDATVVQPPPGDVLAAGANLLTMTAPDTTLSLVGPLVSAGQALLTLTAPDVASVLTGPVSLVAGTPEAIFSAPSATVVLSEAEIRTVWGHLAAQIYLRMNLPGGTDATEAFKLCVEEAQVLFPPPEPVNEALDNWLDTL